MSIYTNISVSSHFYQSFEPNQEGAWIDKISTLYFHKMRELSSVTETNCQQLKLKYTAFVNQSYFALKSCKLINLNIIKESLKNFLEEGLKKIEESPSNFTQIFQNSYEKILSELTAKLGARIVSQDFEIDEADLHEQQIDQDLGKEYAKRFDCLCYALYKLKEEQAEDWLFNKTQAPLSKLDALTFFVSQCFYDIVASPKAGDLIIYFNEYLEPKHYGLFVDEQTVQSKWGSFPQIFEHKIETVPAYYGNQYLVLRKRYTPLN